MLKKPKTENNPEEKNKIRPVDDPIPAKTPVRPNKKPGKKVVTSMAPKHWAECQNIPACDLAGLRVFMAWYDGKTVDENEFNAGLKLFYARPMGSGKYKTTRSVKKEIELFGNNRE